jgi:hypothetical protein
MHLQEGSHSRSPDPIPSILASGDFGPEVNASQPGGSSPSNLATELALEILPPEPEALTPELFDLRSSYLRKYAELMPALPEAISVIREKLDSLASEERENLLIFWKELMASEQAGYVLFFDKPAALIAPLPQGHRPTSFGPYNSEWESIKQLGLSAHQKFCPENAGPYAFVKVERPEFAPGNDRVCDLIFLHKERCLAIIDANMDVFTAAYGEATAPSEMLKLIMGADHKILPALGGNHAAMGLLLGFGRTDSLTFQRERQLEADPATLLEYRALRMGRRDEEAILSGSSEFQDLNIVSRGASRIGYVTWEDPDLVTGKRLAFARQRLVLSHLVEQSDFLLHVASRLLAPVVRAEADRSAGHTTEENNAKG